jgi:hypothetical protein
MRSEQMEKTEKHHFSHLSLDVCYYAASGLDGHDNESLRVLRLEQPVGATRVVLERVPHHVDHGHYVVSPTVPRYEQLHGHRLQVSDHCSP